MAYINGSEHGSSGYGADYEPYDIDDEKEICPECGKKKSQCIDGYDFESVEVDGNTSWTWKEIWKCDACHDEYISECAV